MSQKKNSQDRSFVMYKEQEVFQLVLNYGHVLQLCTETVVSRWRMFNDLYYCDVSLVNEDI